MIPMQSRVARGLLPAALIATGGCSVKAPQIAACEKALMPSLKAPSTYRLIDSTVGLEGKDGKTDVFLHYDAANSYNAPIRSSFWCEYNAKTGSAAAHEYVDSGVDDMMPTAIPPTAPKSAASPTATSPSVQPPERFDEDRLNDEVPVCDQPDSPEKRALMNELQTDCTGE